MKKMMEYQLVAVAAVIFSFGVSAKTYEFGPAVDAHNMIMFQVNHQGFSRSIGFFTEFSGSLYLHSADLSKEPLINSSIIV